MPARKVELTELEGAALICVRALKTCTAYQVRQVFRESPSTEWSASSGAIYPAIARLNRAGFLKAKNGTDKRGTVHYTLTPSGVAALERWLLDAERAAGPGMDPFRTRAIAWRFLSPAKRAKLRRDATAAIEKRRAELERQLKQTYEFDREGHELYLALLDLRLKYLAKMKD